MSPCEPFCFGVLFVVALRLFFLYFFLRFTHHRNLLCILHSETNHHRTSFLLPIFAPLVAFFCHALRAHFYLISLMYICSWLCGLIGVPLCFSRISSWFSKYNPIQATWQFISFEINPSYLYYELNVVSIHFDRRDLPFCLNPGSFIYWQACLR